MNREEMIKELKTIDLRAIPTVVTMDMGLQYDYITADGAGTGFGGMGNWPAHMFSPINKEQWTVIRNGIENRTITMEQLIETGLDTFIQKIQTLDEEIVLSELLEDLLTLPEELKSEYYCLFDTGVWYAKGDNPVFFGSEEQLKNAFIDRYVDDLTYWEDMNDDELASWYERIKDDMKEFSVCVYCQEE